LIRDPLQRAASAALFFYDKAEGEREMAHGEKFERHRQPWRQDEIQKLHQLAAKGMSLKAIAKALTRSEESVKDRAKSDGLRIAKLR
jgi:DNA-binding NarL/FixJ family response regulator